MKKIIISSLILVIAGTFWGISAIIPDASAADPKFRLPLDYNIGYYQYYDHNMSVGPGQVRDWQCGTKTYDEHHGVDFRANYGNTIRAGAIGSLYYRVDGCPDYGSWSETCGSKYGNHVRMDHEGAAEGSGWVSIYAHMKKGTPAWYQTAMCSAKIGEAASSGKSTAVHLHFEIWKYKTPDNDPFAGACSGPTSFWVNQNGGWPTNQCQ